MTNPLYIITTLPADDQAALREFREEYLMGIGAVQPPNWSDMGDMIPTNSPLVTFPISSLALKYQQTEGEDRFKTLLSKSFDMKSQEFDTGIEAPYLDLLQNVFAYRNWSQGPARMLIAEARFRNRSISTLLESGASTAWVDGANFFSATHLSDMMDPSSTTWSNYQSVGKDVLDFELLEAELTTMRGVRDENGEKIGVEPDTILVPTEKFEALKNKLAKDMILDVDGSAFAATNNVFKGRFNVIHVPELSDANDWYLLDSKLRSTSGLPPWISLRYTAPDTALSLRTWDTSSDHFKNTGRIKVSSHVYYGFALGFPHVIRKVVGA